MVNPFESILRLQGIVYQIERDGNITHATKGLINFNTSTKRKFIGVPVNTDIKVGDWLINPSGNRFYVEETETSYFSKNPASIDAFYLTEKEYKTDNAPLAAPVFNVNNAYGSVIGTQAHVTLNYNDCIEQIKKQISSFDSDDNKQLNEIVVLLEKIMSEKEKPTKGMLAKFSDVMERNSWISGSIASALLSWAMMPR